MFFNFDIAIFVAGIYVWPENSPMYNVADVDLKQMLIINRVNCEQRICTLCVLREIEDDFHFVIKCTAYSARRSKHISHYFFIEDLASLSMYIFCSHLLVL